MGGVRPDPLFWSSVSRLQALSASQPGLIRPTKYTHFAAAAPFQPRKRVDLPPSFTSLEAMEDKLKHFAAAEEVDHPLEGSLVYLPADQRDAIRMITTHLHDIPRMRLERLEELSSIAADLMPLSATILASSKDHVRAAVGPNANPAFAAAVVIAIDWPDVHFPRDHFYSGHDVLGHLPDFGLWRIKDPELLASEKAASVPVAELASTNVQWNASLAARLRHRYRRAQSRLDEGDDSAMDDFNSISEATAKERVKGLVQVLSLEELDERFGYGKYRADERFIVHQAEKNRPCENCRASGKNLTCVTEQGVVFAPADAAAGVARLFFEASQRNAWDFPWEFGAASDDEPDAYRNSAASDQGYTVFFFVDAFGVVKAGVPRGLNFGLKAAVEQYCRKPALVVAFLRRFLWVPADHYVDDFQTAEPSFCRGEEVVGEVGPKRFPASGQAMLWATYGLLGYRPLKLEKSSMWCVSSAPFVGTVSDFSLLSSDGLISISIKPVTRAKALVLVIEALRSNELTPAAAGSLYGKLRWVFCLGRVALGALHDVKSRQYAVREREDWRLDVNLKSSLEILHDFLRAPSRPAVVRCVKLSVRPTLVWSDAMWEPRPGLPYGFGRIGFVVKAPRPNGLYDIFYSKAEAPQDFLAVLAGLRDQKTFIHPLEMLGIIAPYICPELAPLLQGVDVIHFGDNNAANSAAIKGVSGARDLSRLALILHSSLASSATRIWIERVCSDGNIADEPSRDDIDTLVSMGAVELGFVFPDLLARAGLVP